MSRKPGVPASQTKEGIGLAALSIIDEEGSASFSMRRLAAHLNMSPMGLYTYFKSKDDLMVYVYEMLHRQYDISPIPGERWDDTIRRSFASIRSVYLQHPQAFTFFQAWMPERRPHLRRTYRLHKDQGMPAEIYSKLWLMADVVLAGFIGQEINQNMSLTPDFDRNDPDIEWITATIGAYSDDSFALMTEMVIAGTRHIAAPDPCEWRTPADQSLWSWHENG